MNIYTIYAELKEGVHPRDFVQGCSEFLDSLPQVKAYRITRMKLGFRSKDLGEWRIDMEFETMQDMDDAMTRTLSNPDSDAKHRGFNQYIDVDYIDHFLYRDWPDEV